MGRQGVQPRAGLESIVGSMVGSNRSALHPPGGLLARGPAVKVARASQEGVTGSSRQRPQALTPMLLGRRLDTIVQEYVEAYLAEEEGSGAGAKGQVAAVLKHRLRKRDVASIHLGRIPCQVGES